MMRNILMLSIGCLALALSTSSAFAYEAKYGGPFTFNTSRLGNYVNLELAPSTEPGTVTLSDSESGFSSDAELSTPGTMGLSVQLLTSDSGSIELNMGRKKDLQSLASTELTDRLGIVTRKRGGDSQKWSTFLFSLNYRTYEDPFFESAPEAVEATQVMASPAVVIGRFISPKVSIEFFLGMSLAFETLSEIDSFGLSTAELKYGTDYMELSDRVELRFPLGFKTSYEVKSKFHVIYEITAGPSFGRMADMALAVPINMALGARYVINEFVVGGSYVTNFSKPEYEDVSPGISSALDLEDGGIMITAGWAFY